MKRRQKNYKLTEAQRIDILTQYQCGVKTDAIARQYGVGPDYPGKLARRRGLTPRPAGRWSRDRHDPLVG